MLVIGKRLTYSGWGFDEQWFLWGGWSILKGLAPYRDFHDFKPPVLFLTEAAAIAIFGNEDQHFRLFFLGLAVASVAAVVLALMFRGIGALLSLAVGFLIAGMYFDTAYHDAGLNDVESIALAYYLFGLALLVSARNRPWLQRWGTAFLALCVLTKEPFVFLALPTWLAFLFDPGDANGGRLFRPLRGYVKASVIGGATPALLVIAYLAIVGGLKDYILGYPRTRIFAETYAVTIHRFVPGSFSTEWAQTWRYLSGGLFSFDRLALWCPLFVAGILSMKRAHAPRVAFGILGLAGSAYAISVGHCFWLHYFLTGIGGLALLGVLCSLQIAVQSRDVRTLRVIGAMMLMALFPSVRARYDADIHTTFLAARPNVDPAVLDYVVKNTEPNDYILSNAPALYFFSKRKGAITYNSFLDEVIGTFPGKTDEERLARLGDQLRRRMPKIVYMEQVVRQRGGRHLDELVYPFLQEKGYTLLPLPNQVYLRPY